MSEPLEVFLYTLAFLSAFAIVMIGSCALIHLLIEKDLL